MHTVLPMCSGSKIQREMISNPSALSFKHRLVMSSSCVGVPNTKSLMEDVESLLCCKGYSKLSTPEVISLEFRSLL